MEAFEKGDYETALRESKLLAKQGDAEAHFCFFYLCVFFFDY